MATAQPSDPLVESAEVSRPKRSMSRRWWWSLALCIPPLVMLIFGALWLEQEVQHKPFDRALWLTSLPESGERESMVEAILKDELRAGATRESVITLLGEPDWDFPAREHHPFGYRISYIDRLHVQLFSSPRKVGFEEDGSWLEFHCDAQGQITRAFYASHEEAVIFERQLTR